MGGGASGFVLLGEAVALGVASGPVCVAACGPVLVPALLAEPGGVRPAANTLSIFLGARLAGYLIFATVAWEAGVLIALPPATRLMLTATIDVLLAVVMIGFAMRTRSRPAHACAASHLVKIGEQHPRRVAGPAALGLLTGLNLCPPFVAAGVRAAQSASLPQALAFFAAFFVGTSLWFVPLGATACIARNQGVTTVARITMVLVGLYYLLLGISLFAGGRIHGNWHARAACAGEAEHGPLAATHVAHPCVVAADAVPSGCANGS